MATIRPRDGKKGRSYQVQVRKAGFETQSQTFTKKKMAQDWATRVEAAMESGNFVSQRSASGMSMVEALQRYLIEITPSKKSAKGEESLIRQVLKVRIFDRSLTKLRPSDFTSLSQSWLASGLKPSSVVRRLALLSHVYTAARKLWHFEGLQNPLLDVVKPKVRDERTRVIDDVTTFEGEEDDDGGVDRQHIENELDFMCRASSSKVLEPAMRFAAQTAMRRGEIASLQWAHVELKKGTAHLPATKNGDSRTVPLSPKAVELLDGMAPRGDRHGPVFKVRADSLSKAFRRALLRARMDYEEACRDRGEEPQCDFLVGLRFHDLRHHATTRLASVFAMHDLAKITGHKSTAQLLRYYHPKTEDFTKVLRKHPGWT